ncbi:hypothetical protein [Aquiflexum lacus]|uniref:hypothetical protein n=1 Tax=Aquiflexum lacus TaxID=2483805 RepID=UPI0018955DAD|nr:hypothetical protein [Aquiflexum lacus]
MFIFKAFRAIDDPTSCLRFIEGHANVLKEYGVTKVGSSNHFWMYNPYVYVVTVEDIQTGMMVSGVRIHIANRDYPLPIEEAIGKIDRKIHDVVDIYRENGTGEVAGLWNSRSIAGYGIGSMFLSRTAIAIAAQLKLESLLALCSEFTIQPTLDKGFQVEESIGKKGRFRYPNVDFISTCAVLRDVEKIPLALPSEKRYIFDLRKNFDSIRVENSLKGDIEIRYDLLIENPDWRLKLCM